MANLFLEVAVRAALIAAGTAVVLWALRIKTPSVRHSAWTAVVIAMLLLPIWSIAGPKLSLPVLEPAPAPARVSAASEPIPAPSTSQSVAIATAMPSTSASTQPISGQDVLVGVYLTGVFVLLLRLAIGTVMANRLRRRAVMEDGRATSAECATPVTVGWLAPVLILPAGWQRWSDEQLNVVLTHEREHALRRDPLVQWVALFNRAVFWFHPLSWWLERRLGVLAEEACDEAVLAAGYSPEAYSGYLLDLARAVKRAGHRVEVVGMAMPGGALSGRIRRMFDGLPMTPISRVRVVAAVTFCVVSSAIFAAGTLAHREVVQTSTSGSLKFDVASIKPCADSAPRPGRRGGAGAASPGYLHLPCFNLRQLLNIASGNSDDRLNALFRNRSEGGFVTVRGGPAWVASEFFAIEAKLEGVTNQKTLSGAPLLALLEDRFQLKFHREKEDRDVYVLTIAPGGLKLQPVAPGSCFEIDPGNMPAPGALTGRQPCGMQMGPLAPFRAKGAKIGKAPLAIGTALADFLSNMMDRVVVDKTGLDARYDIEFQYAPNESTPGVIERFQQGREGGPPQILPTEGPTIFRALENLGLKLTPAKESVEYLVIDRVERLRPNVPAEIVEPPARAEGGSGPKVAQEELASAFAPAQTAGASARQTFEVVSIKPCATERSLPGVAPPPPAGARRGGAFGYHAQTTPGRVYWDCATLATLVDQAYADADHPLLNTEGDSRPAINTYGPSRPKRVRGGPSWVENDKFAVEVKSPLDLTTPALAGSTGKNLFTLPVGMSLALRAALEDRFQVKVRRMTEERDMFALVVAKGGLNPERVKTPIPGDCMTIDEYFATVDQRPPGPNNIMICGRIHSRIEGMAYSSFPLANLAGSLSSMMDNFVVDRTNGVAGVFNFFLNIEPRQRPEGGTEEVRLRKGLAELGLKLEPIKGPAEFLVIDSAQKPRPDFAALAASSGQARAMGGQR